MNLIEANNILHTILNSLFEFKENYHKKFNFSKLCKILSIDDLVANDIIQLILKAQDLMDTVFSEYKLQKKRIDGITYLVTEPRGILDYKESEKVPKIVYLEKEQIKLINDLIYTFKFIEKGKGFNLKNPSTEFLRKVNDLYKCYPYLFRKNGSDLFYPEDVCIKLGEIIYSYNIGNKKLIEKVIDNYHFKFVLDD